MRQDIRGQRQLEEICNRLLGMEEYVKGKAAETEEAVAEWKANHDRKKLEKRAERAEKHAASSIELALYYALAAQAAILEAADTHFRQVGFEKFSMEVLSRDLDVARGTLYRYFSTREELLLNLYQRQQQQERHGHRDDEADEDVEQEHAQERGQAGHEKSRRACKVEERRRHVKDVLHRHYFKLRMQWECKRRR